MAHVDGNFSRDRDSAYANGASQRNPEAMLSDHPSKRLRTERDRDDVDPRHPGPPMSHNPSGGVASPPVLPNPSGRVTDPKPKIKPNDGTSRPLSSSITYELTLHALTNSHHVFERL